MKNQQDKKLAKCKMDKNENGVKSKQIKND